MNLPTFTREQKIAAYKKLSEAKKSAAFSESVADKIEIVTTKHEMGGSEAMALKHFIGAYIVELVSPSFHFSAV